MYNFSFLFTVVSSMIKVHSLHVVMEALKHKNIQFADLLCARYGIVVHPFKVYRAQLKLSFQENINFVHHIVYICNI